MPAGAPKRVAFAIRGPIERTDLSGLCNRVCALLEGSEAAVALCDVRGLEPDAVTVDSLARLQLAVRRHGYEIRLHHASGELLELLDFMGLRDVLPDGSRSRAASGVRRAGTSAPYRGRR
jgi:ABC-type transporter Mla MlaB component